MQRTPARIALEVALTIAVALLLLGPWQWFLGAETLAGGFSEAARLLFLFMDVGLVVWLVLLVVVAARRRPAGVGLTLLFALIGTVTNLLTVIVVGLVQGGWAWLFILFAVEAGVAFLLSATIVVPLVHRVFLRPKAAE
jgi:hypothetical protein